MPQRASLGQRPNQLFAAQAPDQLPSALPPSALPWTLPSTLPLDLVSEVVAPSETPLYQEVLDWATRTLHSVGLSRPFCKRLAVVVCGLVACQKATLGDVTTAIETLALSPAKSESIARRLQRSLKDSRLDPWLLPLIFRPLLPELLQSHLLAHRANIALPTFHHQRFIAVTVIVDETSKLAETHLLVVGIPIGAVVLPLAVRTWAQNVPLEDGDYWCQVIGLLQEIQAMLPGELREHVLLVADRAYGVPRMIDLLSALGWHWLLRVQGTTQVRLQNGTTYPLKTLVPRPGTRWSSSVGTAEAINQANQANSSESVRVFKTAGWRDSQVVAFWAEGSAEPWILVTSLTACDRRVCEYAERWAIERLFLSWKSHGWDVEKSGIRDPQALGRLLTAIALATLWRLAMALPRAFEHLRDLARRVGRAPRQLSLPGFGAPPRPPRPWAAKYSLLTLGAKAAKSSHLHARTPALCWHLPSWMGRSWSDVCHQVCLDAHDAHDAHGQFPISP